jgi:competence protein ComEC
MNRRNVKILCGLFLITIVVFVTINRFETRWLNPNWEVAACDIGQGDATLIRTGEISAMVVDVGPDSMIMKDCLEDFGISKVDLFVASHFHADHIGGISGLVEVSRPSRLITAALSSPTSGVRLVESKVAPTVREIAYVGMYGQFLDSQFPVSWQVLAPANPPSSVDDSDGSSINNNSVVLLVTTVHHRILLTGDVEIDGQNQLMQSVSNPEVDLVKVPHHGSAYQSPEFANWVHAKLAWISVGKDNSYRHPNSTTILSYQTAGSTVLTTMECGHISVGANSYSTSRSCV